VLYSASSPKGKGCLGPQHPAQPNGQRSARSRLSSLGRVGHDMPSQPAKPAHGPARKPGAGPAASRRRMGSNGHPPISARQNRRPVHPPQTLAHFSPSLSSPEPGPAAALTGASRQAGPLAMVARKGPAPSFLFPSTPFLSAAPFGAVVALHRCPSPHGAAARVFFPHTEAMARRRADALAFLSAQPWTAVEQQQVRALCSFFVRVSD